MSKNLFDFADEKFENISEEQMKKAEKVLDNNDIKEKAQRFGKMNKQELNSELEKEVARQKQNGNFNFDEVNNMANKIKHLLTPEQQQNLENLLDKIK